MELAQWYEGKDNIAHSAYHWTEVVECPKNPSIEIVQNSIKYLQLCAELAEKRKRPDAWKWWKKLSSVAEKLSGSSKLRKEIRLKLLGSSLFEHEANLKKMAEKPNDEHSDVEVDLRFLSGVSGVHSPFG